MIGHMVAVGEETGQLEHMLSKVADLVGVIVIAMYLPMFSIYEKIR